MSLYSGDLYDLKSRIIDKSTFSSYMSNNLTVVEIECLGFKSKIDFYKQTFESIYNVDPEYHQRILLVNDLITQSDFLNKFIQIENRNKNLKTLLDE
jgi:hypothetical protein